MTTAPVGTSYRHLGVTVALLRNGDAVSFTGLDKTIMRHLLFAALPLCLAIAPALQAQAPVTAAADVEALFTSADARLNANKQVVYHIMRDLLEAQHWEKADQYLTDAYIQHNPNVPSGRDAVIGFFRGMGAKPKPIPAKLSAPVVQVIAEGDYVTVLTVSTLPRPSDATKTYTTTWMDTFRIKGGKADEHWDSATLMR